MRMPAPHGGVLVKGAVKATHVGRYIPEREFPVGWWDPGSAGRDARCRAVQTKPTATQYRNPGIGYSVHSTTVR